MKKKKVFIAMSGGLDSSVGAALLQKQGYDVEGITMDLTISCGACQNDGRPVGGQAVEDAHKVCQFLKIPHHIVSYQDFFQQTVIDDFVQEYLMARTPNPCIVCNRFVKFGRLFDDARQRGADYLATGHYVNIETMNGEPFLRKANDTRKDQSYFLYGISRNVLPYLLFPLGGHTKEQVRVLAKQMQLPTAEKKESQDICFVPDGDYQKVIQKYSRDPFQEGDIKDSQNNIVGRHRGFAHYTIGQREGLGVALGKPVYIYRMDMASNTIFIGPKECLYAQGLRAKQLNLIGMKFLKETFEANIKIRYNHYDIQGQVSLMDEQTMEVYFDEPQIAVTPGQSVVFYHQDILLGGGIIDHAIF